MDIHEYFAEKATIIAEIKYCYDYEYPSLPADKEVELIKKLTNLDIKMGNKITNLLTDGYDVLVESLNNYLQIRYEEDEEDDY